MNRDYLITIVVPIYNSSKYLCRCINSIINQTYQNLEIILVDDGSTDNSLDMCNKYADKDNRIKVIHKDNSGAAASRNVGINHAMGNYIAFVDSDDYIELDMYEKMINISKQYDCDIVMCDCYKENKNEKHIFTHNIRKGYYDKNMLFNEYFPTLLATNTVDYPSTISNWTCLFKMKIINDYQIRYKEGMRFSEDWLFGSQFMYYANSFYYMKEKCFYHYMMNDSSVTHTYYEDKWTLMKQLYLAIKDFFENKEDYDFNRQIDLSLLFIIYHCIGNIKESNNSKKEKTINILKILNDNEVKEMFKRLKINSLNISWKLKIYTYIYKYKVKGLFYI